MKLRKLSMALIAIGMISASATSMASGSFSSSRSGGGSSGAQDPYNFGKIVLHKKLICNNCPLDADGFDKAQAKNVLMKVTSNAKEVQSLSHRERKAVRFYLSRRFNLQ
ncbi:MAG: hypothetical protein COB04_07710 [Gammaproteobacteria bacterium]|nr:MAG: hypothetical protein COB04_07710 [Gammaproteobacteria bacterium]